MFHHGKKSLRGQYTVPAWQPGVPVPMRLIVTHASGTEMREQLSKSGPRRSRE